AFLAHYDENGRSDRSLDLGTASSVHIKALACQDGHVNVAGWFWTDPMDLDPRGAHHILTPSAGTSGDAFLARYAVDGHFEQGFSLSGHGTSAGFSSSIVDLAVDASGNVLATGAIDGTCDFAPAGTGSAERTVLGEQDHFLAKYRPDGNLAWVHMSGGAGVEHGNGVVVGTTGIFACGYNSSTGVDVDERPDHELLLNSAGASDLLLLHYPPPRKVEGGPRDRRWIPIPTWHIPYYIGAAVVLVVVVVIVVRTRQRANASSAREEGRQH
ncbi:MAG: hypothetical protein WAU70_12745, partial [Flavobacteriales bacterium]